MQRRNNGKTVDYQSQHHQAKAPSPKAQNPQHHNGVLGLYTSKQQTKAAKNEAALEGNNLANADQLRRLGQ